MDAAKALPLATTAKFVLEMVGTAVVIVNPSLGKVSEGGVWG